jgi:hypothetical protein
MPLIGINSNVLILVANYPVPSRIAAGVWPIR